MGLSVNDVMGMSLHDYEAAIHHFNAHHVVEEDAEPLGEDDFDDMLFGMAEEGMH